LNEKLLQELGSADVAAQDAANRESAAVAQIAKLKREIAAEQAKVTAWTKMIETYQTALIKLPGSLPDLAAKATGTTSLANAVKDIQAKATSGGKLSAEEIKEIGELLNKIPNELRAKVENQLQEAPGIAIRILGLGLELAELEKKRAESRLADIALKREIYEEAFVDTRIAEILLADIHGNETGGLLRPEELNTSTMFVMQVLAYPLIAVTTYGGLI